MSNSYRKQPALFIVILSIATCGSLGAGTGIASAEDREWSINYYSTSAVKQCTTGKSKVSNEDKYCRGIHPGDNFVKDYFWFGQVKIVWYQRDDSSTESDCKPQEWRKDPLIPCPESESK